jgi:flagellar basal-body rod modification protein FlgD
MTVAAVNSSVPASGAASSSTAATAASSMVNYNDFLTILMAELKNQDPTQPSDPAQMVSQLASFSQVEQQVNTNSKLDSLLSSMAITQAGSLIGHTVTSSDGSQSGTVASVNVTSSGSVAVLNSGSQIPLNGGITIS